MSKRIALVEIVLCSLVLTACAGLPPNAQVPSEPNPATNSKSALPAVDLSQQLLYDLLLGEIAGQRGHLNVAIESLKRAALTSRDPRLAQRATQVALYAKKPEDAVVTARLWVELQPKNIESREALSVSLLEQGSLSEAQSEMEQILALNNTEGKNTLGHAYLRLAALLGKQSLRGAALEVMQSLTAKHPDVPEGQYALAHVAVRASELEVAMKSIDRALLLTPGWDEAALFKIRILTSMKEPKKIESFYEQFLTDFPDSKNVRLGYARHLVDTKQWERASDQFKRVVADNPNDGDAVYAIGLLALQSEVFDEAETYFKRTLDLQPHNDQARMYLGHVAEKRKRYDEASKWYGEVKSESLQFEAQVRVGMLAAKKGDVGAARAHFATLEPESENQEVQLLLAEDEILREVKHYDDAFNVLTSGLKQYPDNNDLLYARALTAERLDRIDIHESDLRKILKSDPKNANALNALGYTLADRTTRFQEALELIEQALELKPEDPYIMDSMGWVQYRLGNYAEAKRYLQAALEKRNDAEISAHLGEVLWMMGDKAGAETVWYRALQHTPDNELLLGVINKFKR